LSFSPSNSALSPNPNSTASNSPEPYKQPSFRNTVVIPSASIVSAQAGASGAANPSGGPPADSLANLADTPPAGDPIPDANFALSVRNSLHSKTNKQTIPLRIFLNL